MTTFRTSALVLSVALAGSPVARADEPKPDAKGIEFFEKKIRPALVEHCYKCHSAEANKTKGGLALDTRAGMREGGESGPAIVPGETTKGTLLKALRHDGAVKMPNEQKKLPDAVIADFEAWVKIGAPDPRDGKSAAKKGIDFVEARKHWAYQPVKSPASPAVKNAAWPANDIDRFVLAKIEASKLAPATDAANSAWLRRVTFDLTGLPPTPEEVDAFAKDATPDAHAKVVDRLLASPRFGEHWARHWLDGARFAQTVVTSDRYRDWVVRAINADVPYDQFIAYQIAGDLLPPSDDVKVQADRVAATQFLALSYREMDPVEGMVEVFGQHVLGVSINCAKCHDHKFDAYTQRDYYALAGVFTSSRIAGAKGAMTDGVAVPGEAGAKVLALTENGKSVGDTNLLVRGEKTQKGALVPRRLPVVLAGDAQTPLGKLTKDSGRLQLATWAVSKDNPLTARVFANRVWQRFFGAGIVRTPNDFGLAGDAPTHPELLDYLAHTFAREHKWSVKKLVRDIALSHTYRQSATNEPAHAADTENHLVARVPVRRMSYEQIIDNLNAVGGALAFDVAPRPKNGLDYPRFNPNRNATGPAYRALYHDDAPLRNLLDGADPELITESRDSSVTAPQMLFFMNNPQVIALAGKVAKRAEALAGKPDADAKLTAAYTLLFARTPTDKERDAAKKYLAKYSFDKLCHVLICSSEFTYLE